MYMFLLFTEASYLSIPKNMRMYSGSTHPQSCQSLQFSWQKRSLACVHGKRCSPCSLAVARKAINDASECEDGLTSFCHRSVVFSHMPLRRAFWPSASRSLRGSVALQSTCRRIFFCGCLFAPPGMRRGSFAPLLSFCLVAVASATLFHQGLIAFVP